MLEKSGVVDELGGLAGTLWCRDAVGWALLDDVCCRDLETLPSRTLSIRGELRLSSASGRDDLGLVLVGRMLWDVASNVRLLCGGLEVYLSENGTLWAW